MNQKYNSMIKHQKDIFCPIRGILDRLGDQWSFLVLTTLEHGKLRFNELQREIGDISKQMLSKTLKHLEQDGFIVRTLYAEVPPRVEYELTDLGRSILVPINELVHWASIHKNIIQEARKEYNASEQS